MRRWLLTPLLCAACAAPVPVPPPPPPAPPPPAPAASILPYNPKEFHLRNLRQLTFGGENAEAYWSWASDALILQARPPEASCDRIFRLPLAADASPASAM